MEHIEVKASREREAREYKRRHPYDCLQPNDRLFDKVWGEKIKRQNYKMERGKRDAELKYEKAKERREFKSVRTGGEWKKRIFV
jgi:hypothetical protein